MNFRKLSMHPLRNWYRVCIWVSYAPYAVVSSKRKTATCTPHIDAGLVAHCGSVDWPRFFSNVTNFLR